MPVLPSYRNQSIGCANQSTGFYKRATLAFNGLISVTYSMAAGKKSEKIFMILLFPVNHVM